MSLVGKYQIVKNEGILEHLIAQGVPAERAAKFVEGSNIIEITINGDDITIVRGDGHNHNYTHNKETIKTTPDGNVIKNFSMLNGTSLTVESSNSQGKWKKIYKLSDSGSELTVTLKSETTSIADGTRIYKKI
ncbi:uncharacterized protein [Euwallacea fornicatus]|uniref:uncharacterized protein n=1 Tax=Euwallacea fornicatus TaxID=995702 RepID=UPI00338E847F